MIDFPTNTNQPTHQRALDPRVWDTTIYEPKAPKCVYSKRTRLFCWRAIFKPKVERISKDQ